MSTEQVIADAARKVRKRNHILVEDVITDRSKGIIVVVWDTFPSDKDEEEIFELLQEVDSRFEHTEVSDLVGVAPEILEVNNQWSGYNGYKLP